VRAGPGEAFSTSFASRVEALREEPAFANYLTVRERVMEMKEREADLADGDLRPSDYWHEELEGFEYMLDASPLVVDKLRHHTYHLTGLRVYEYRSQRDKHRRALAEKLEALRELGEDLAVPESPALGGFGFEIDGGLWNVDTLKFLECSLALRRGGVLPALVERPGRLAVWEVGGGWGGYAHHFKTLFPDTTYLITDLPEVLLFSATYLMTVFPDARVRFHAPGDGAAAFADLDEVDFVFASNTALAETRPARLDLALNMVSFQEMTTAQVRGYARHARELGCPWLYSLNRDRSHYNVEISSVGQVLRESYWMHEVPMLPVSYPQPLPPKWRKRRPAPAPERYKHLVGWPRLHP